MDATEHHTGYAIYAPPQAVVADLADAAQQPMFFPVGLTKLAVLSVCTLGLYPLHWFYQSWRGVPGRSSGRAEALVMTLFCGLTAYFLFREVERASARSGGPPSVGAGMLAAGFFGLSAMASMPDPYWLVSLFTVVPLLPVAQLINRLNAQLRPRADPNSRFTAANIAWAAVGGIFLLLVVAGLLIGPEPAAAFR
jgi:hypothetical protein